MTIEKPENQDITRDSSGRFIPGQSGNPAGRLPKNFSITSLLKDKATQIEPKSGLTYAQLVVDKVYHLAIDTGNLAAAQEILNRHDGKVAEHHKIEGIMIHATPEMLEAAQDRLKISMGSTEQLLADYRERKLLGQGVENNDPK